MNTKHTKHTTDKGIEYWRVASDANGNSRYVVHYLTIPYPVEYTGSSVQDYRAHQLAHQAHAARLLGGTHYRAKWFGGGIVFTSFNVEHDVHQAIDQATD